MHANHGCKCAHHCKNDYKYNNSSGLPPSEVADARIKTTYRNAIIGRLTLMYFNLGQLIAAELYTF